MSDKIDHVIEILTKAKRDRRTLVIVAGCVISFGVAVGSIAVYERLIRELDISHDKAFFKKD